ncbi:ABC transporter permease [Leifsonia lichenia]
MFDLQFFSSTLTTVAPLLFAALGALLCFRSGFFNIAIEGQLLVAAFSGAVVAKATGDALLAVVTACVAATVLGAIVAVATYVFRVDAIVAGIAANLLAAGVTALLTRELSGGSSSIIVSDGRLPRVAASVADRIPFVGGLIAGQTPLVFLAFALALALAWALKRTRTGLAIRALGESVESVGGAGISVARIRTIVTVGCGILCGFGGAQLALGPATSFSVGMTNGRGFTAIVAAMIGTTVASATLGTFLFGIAEAIGLRVQLSDTGLPQAVVQMVPYVLALIVLAAASRIALSGVDPVQRRILRQQ